MDPKKIKWSFLLFFEKSIKSLQKQTTIASNDPRCKLTSTSKELRLKLLMFEIIIKWADELTGINSVTPWIIDNIITSK